MSSKVNVVIEMKDLSLKGRLAAHLAGDWTISWNMVEASRNPAAAATASVAILDDESCLQLFGKSTTLIFAGTPSEPKRYFKTVCIDKEDPADELFKSVKLAFGYRETTRQNIESLYPGPIDGSPLESLANSLTDKFHEIEKLSEMRLSLIEQLPIGVVGIDDEEAVVLANPKAIELLGLEDIPIWGMEAETLFKGQAKDFLKDKDAKEIEIKIYEERIIIRKSPFILENKPAGTILILLRP